MDDGAWDAGIEETIREIFRLTVSLGGTISGEHGIGYTQKAYLPIALSAAEIGLMKGVKQAFDPAGILNPGKIFP
jgi:glycolate oxidase